MRPGLLVILATVATLAPSIVAAQAPSAPPAARTAATVAAEQRRPVPAGARGRATLSNGLQIRAFGSVGTTWFTSSSTFKAVLGSGTGQDFGGGMNITQGPGYLEIGARRFTKTGERVFVTDRGEVFPLGIPATVTMTPLEVAAGWRFRPRFGRVIPHLGAGYTRMKYEETSDFAGSGEDVAESFNGYHVIGGAEVRVARWVGITGEVVWTSVPDGLGQGGASKAFDENNLGGTSIRLKLVIGR